jgi:ABC-type multidrug transport system ATPase subunit
MNENMLNLAVRTTYLLKVAHSDDKTLLSISHYFQKAGINVDIPDNSYQQESVFNQIDELCAEINNTLNFKEKVSLLLLVQDCLLTMHDNHGFIESLIQIFNCLGLDGALIAKFKGFLEQDDIFTFNNKDYLLLSPRSTSEDDRLEGRWIDNNTSRDNIIADAFDPEQFNNHLLVMYVDQIKSYVVRCLSKAGRLFDEDTERQCTFRLLGPGHELNIKGVPVITFSNLKSRFLKLDEKGELRLEVDQVSYSNQKGVSEINTFSTEETTGQLIGIVGREGVGKSTMLKLLAGKMKPDKGNITINGYDLWKNKYFLKGIIGFVPEEDLLFEELSIFDNLVLTARLFYSTFTQKEINDKVNALLSRLDLLDLKHVKAGSVDSKHIQPGQRRLINIALELLREPQILLVDNALSGLGMSDSSRVIKILHDYSFAGNLVITSISQADSSSFLLFDKIWILDEGGSAVYNGPVKEAPGYLIRKLKLNNQEIHEADPAQLLDLVNYRLPDKKGQVWKRVMESADWHSEYLKNQLIRDKKEVTKAVLPARILKIPNLEIQLLIFSIRNLKCKFAYANDIIKTLAIGPVIALLISVLFRFSGEGQYSLLNNVNLPIYQFVSVIAAVFLGLIASADEIIRERNILEKEEYLEFSMFSYLNSKILYLFPVVAIQLLLYGLVGNMVMGIRELFWVYWIVLFSAACFGILLGLVFSAGVQNKNFLHKGVLPFVIAIQVLLGGGLISYNQLNLGNNKYTPWIGDLMVSRWGYEALAVEQYKNNKYEKLIYTIDKQIDQAAFYIFRVVPLLEESLISCRTSQNPDSTRQFTGLLQHEMTEIVRTNDVFRFEYLPRLPEIITNEKIAQETSDYLTYLSLHFYEQHQQMIQRKSFLMERLTDSLGTEKLAAIKERYHNLALEKAVSEADREEEYAIIDHDIIPLKGMIYKEPRSNIGRAKLSENRDIVVQPLHDVAADIYLLCMGIVRLHRVNSQGFSDE